MIVNKATIAGAILAALAAGCVLAQEREGAERPDLSTGASKRLVEGPLKRALADSDVPVVVADPKERARVEQTLRMGMSKGMVEMPLKDAVGLRLGPRDLPIPAVDAQGKVEPGKVRWHEGFAKAKAAASRSGKPILLFQLLGKLDDAFC